MPFEVMIRKQVHHGLSNPQMEYATNDHGLWFWHLLMLSDPAVKNSFYIIRPFFIYVTLTDINIISQRGSTVLSNCYNLQLSTHEKREHNSSQRFSNNALGLVLNWYLNTMMVNEMTICDKKSVCAYKATLLFTSKWFASGWLGFVPCLTWLPDRSKFALSL